MDDANAKRNESLRTFFQTNKNATNTAKLQRGQSEGEAEQFYYNYNCNKTASKNNGDANTVNYTYDDDVVHFEKNEAPVSAVAGSRFDQAAGRWSQGNGQIADGTAVANTDYNNANSPVRRSNSRIRRWSVRGSSVSREGRLGGNPSMAKRQLSKSVVDTNQLTVSSNQSPLKKSVQDMSSHYTERYSYYYNNNDAAVTESNESQKTRNSEAHSEFGGNDATWDCLSLVDVDIERDEMKEGGTGTKANTVFDLTVDDDVKADATSQEEGQWGTACLYETGNQVHGQQHTPSPDPWSAAPLNAHRNWQQQQQAQLHTSESTETKRVNLVAKIGSGAPSTSHRNSTSFAPHISAAASELEYCATQHTTLNRISLAVGSHHARNNESPRTHRAGGIDVNYEPSSTCATLRPRQELRQSTNKRTSTTAAPQSSPQLQLQSRRAEEGSAKCTNNASHVSALFKTPLAKRARGRSVDRFGTGAAHTANAQWMSERDISTKITTEFGRVMTAAAGSAKPQAMVSMAGGMIQDNNKSTALDELRWRWQRRKGITHITAPRQQWVLDGCHNYSVAATELAHQR